MIPDMRYPGGKGQAGTYHKIINLMPPHEVYIETHLGGGNILERKKPALATIAIDADAALIDQWRKRNIAGVTLIHGDAAAFIKTYPFTGNELVYSDPPYVMSTRRGGKIYRHEYTDQDHEQLLSSLLAIPACVMLSGYRNAMYDDSLKAWNRIDFQAMTRAGPAIESVWFNFEQPQILHDVSYAGHDFRERERIKRKKLRWRAKLQSLPSIERQAILEILMDLAIDHR